MSTVNDPDTINDTTNKVCETYRTYALVCTQDRALCVGEVFKDGIRVAYCESLDLKSAQQHLRRIVDWHIKDAIKLRSNAIPDKELWQLATQHVLNDANREIKETIHKLGQSDEDFVEISTLAKVANLSSTAELHYLLSDFARKICDYIAYEPPCSGDGRDSYLSLICENSISNDSVRLSSVFSTILKNYRP